MMMRFSALSLATSALLALGGCGQKGPLYLPDRNPSVVGGGVPPPAQSRLAVPAPAPQPQSAPEHTIPGSPAQPIVTPAQDAPPRDKQAQQPPKKNSNDSDQPAAQ
jgi:Prokaryotic lipoprotein-attachment site